MKKLTFAGLAALIATGAGPALAHTGHGATTGLIAGLAHPVFGLDHLLAMLAVGLWSGFVLPRRLWLGAAAFLAAMVAGATLSWAGIALPWVEAGIVASVVLFGALTLASRRGQAEWITTASLVAIGGFAMFHGHAHATEAAGAILPYLAGFLMATGALHLAGIGIARAVAVQPLAQKVMGGGIAASGLWLAFG